MAKSQQGTTSTDASMREQHPRSHYRVGSRAHGTEEENTGLLKDPPSNELPPNFRTRGRSQKGNGGDNKVPPWICHNTEGATEKAET